MSLLLVAAVQVLLQAQTPHATIRGTVVDEESGEPLVGAVVALTLLNRSVVTDPRGLYLLHQVPNGPQRLTVRFIGHAPRQVNALVPSAGELEINVSLRPVPLPLALLAVHAPVAVRGIGADDTTTFGDRATSIAAVRQDGRLAEPDVLQALGGGEVSLSPESPSGVNLRGGSSDQVAYLLDGIPVFSPYHSAGVFSAWNPDAIAGLRLAASGPSLTRTHALSGAVAAETRAPGTRTTSRGSLSTTQARVTFDGPLGGQGAGYLVSLRSGFAGDATHKRESSYLSGGARDGLVRLDLPAFGGRFLLLGYQGSDEFSAAARVGPVVQTPGGNLRNQFTWLSRSIGLEWQRRSAATTLRLRGWHASGEANVNWAAESGAFDLTSGRRDIGVLASVERRSERVTSLIGVRAELSRTNYRIDSDSAARSSWGLEGRTPLATAFAQHTRPLSNRVQLRLGASLTAAAGGLRLSPGAQVEWTVMPVLRISGGYDRTHQFAQSLRNAESIAGTVFPVDLYVGAGATGVPVARSDQATLSADLRPRPGVHLAVQTYARHLGGLVLVAPRDGEPVATAGYAVGSGRAHGVSLEAGLSARRFGVLASYGFQRVRYQYGDASYVPNHGAAHQVQAGLTVVPLRSLSVRVGATGIFGRRGTAVSGDVTSESCNLLDRGCEFAGSPNHNGEALGGLALPAYFRVDIGLRKEWELGIGGRAGTVALFGTLTNVFNRKNLLSYARDSATGRLSRVDLRPRAPLVVGLDWTF